MANTVSLEFLVRIVTCYISKVLEKTKFSSTFFLEDRTYKDLL